MSVDTVVIGRSCEFLQGIDLKNIEDFFFNDTATTEIYTLSLHDALPIYLIMIVLDMPLQILAI